MTEQSEMIRARRTEINKKRSKMKRKINSKSKSNLRFEIRIAHSIPFVVLSSLFSRFRIDYKFSPFTFGIKMTEKSDVDKASEKRSIKSKRFCSRSRFRSVCSVLYHVIFFRVSHSHRRLRK